MKGKNLQSIYRLFKPVEKILALTVSDFLIILLKFYKIKCTIIVAKGTSLKKSVTGGKQILFLR